MFIIFGFGMLIFSVCSFLSMRSKKAPRSLLFGICSLICYFALIPGWTTVLVESGKNPAFLGFEAYPIISIPVYLIALCSIVFTIISIVMIVKHHKKH